MAGFESRPFLSALGALLVLCVLLALLLPDMRAAIGILGATMLVSGSFMHFALARRPAKDDSPDDASLLEIVEALRQQSQHVRECLQSLQTLKRKLGREQSKPSNKKSTHKMELELVQLGAADQVLSIAESCEALADQKLLLCLELLNMLLAESSARDLLFQAAPSMQDFVDRYIAAVKRLDQNTGERIEPAESRSKFLVAVCVGLTLMAIQHPVAQSRIGDKGGLFFVHQLVQTKHVMNRAAVARWATSCLMTLTSDHPPNKAEFFRTGGLRTVLSVLQSHGDNAEIIRYSLKLLHNVIDNDDRAMHSVARARELCFELQITNVVLEAKKRFPKDPHIGSIAGSTLQLMACNFS